MRSRLERGEKVWCLEQREQTRARRGFDQTRSMREEELFVWQIESTTWDV